MSSVTPHIDSSSTSQTSVERAVEGLRAGELVVFPTETVYGIGASALSEKGIAALRAFKAMAAQRPLTVHIAQASDAQKYADLSHPTLRRLVRKIFPGPVTLIVDVSDDVLLAKLTEQGLPPEVRERICFNHSVGLRCPDHPVARRFLAAVNGPVLAAIASRSGDVAPVDFASATRATQSVTNLALDGGNCRFGKPSTIVRVRTGQGQSPKVTVEQVGVYDERFIRKLMRWTILLVCSGNTCRSPMAEGLAKQILAQERNIPVQDLETAGIRVISAGTFAGPGMAATPEAVEALAKMDIDLSRHRSKMVTPEMVNEADVIFCMTRSHQKAVLELMPSAADKTLLLDANGDIEDPVGGDLTTYQRTAERIRRQLQTRLKEQQT